MAYYDDKNEVECPFCGEKQYLEDWYPEDERTIELKCHNCEKDFTITPSFSYSLQVDCGTIEKNECVYKKMIIKDAESWTEDHKKIYSICINCDETAFVLPERITA